MSYTPGPSPRPEPPDRRLVEDPRSGPGRLDRGDVGVEGVDRGEDLVGVGVAEMGVDLGTVARAGGRPAVRVHRPGEVPVLSGPPQRKQLAQRRFVHLDDTDAGRFEVAHSVDPGPPLRDIGCFALVGLLYAMPASSVMNKNWPVALTM